MFSCKPICFHLIMLHVEERMQNSIRLAGREMLRGKRKVLENQIVYPLCSLTFSRRSFLCRCKIRAFIVMMVLHFVS